MYISAKCEHCFGVAKHIFKLWNASVILNNTGIHMVILGNTEFIPENGNPHFKCRPKGLKVVLSLT